MSEVLTFRRDEVPLSLVASYVPQGATIVELGAHDGKTLMRLCQLLKPSKYVAVEADVRNAHSLKETARGYGPVGSTFVYVPWVVAAPNAPAAKRLRLSQMSDGRFWSQSTTAKAPTKHLERFPSVTFVDGPDVTTIALEMLVDMCLEGKSPGLLWLDIEGSEREVLTTLAAHLLQKIPVIVMEAHDEALHEDSWTRADAVAWLVERGFRLVAQGRQDILLVRS